MSKVEKIKQFWNLELDCKPDFDKAMKRILAWYEGQILDRPPVRFSTHNAEYDVLDASNARWKSVKDRWYDTEYQVEKFIKGIEGKKFLGETFPVYWPNLGPNVFAAFHGSELEFGEVTSWAEPCLEDYKDINKIQLDMNCEYLKKLEEMTKYALDRCEGKFMVGYTDLHPGMDCLAAWRDSQNLCFDFYDYPEEFKQALTLSMENFQKVFDYFDNILKAKNQLSVTWMNIPSFGKMHIPSCDFSAMISKDLFNEYHLPLLQEEVKGMDHNVFHLDGKGVAKHIDSILEVKEINAIQWVQGLGVDKPIMQWLPLIKKIQSSGKSVVVDLDKTELEEFISSIDPKGLLLCIDSNDEEEQMQILKRIEKW